MRAVMIDDVVLRMHGWEAEKVFCHKYLRHLSGENIHRFTAIYFWIFIISCNILYVQMGHRNTISTRLSIFL